MKHSTRVLTTGVAVAATVGALAACAPAAEEQTEPTSLTIGIVSPVTLTEGDASPFTGALLSATLTWMPVYESLLVWDPVDSGWDPWLATDYEISEDRQTLTITLRDDVDFIDGAHLDAEGLATYFSALYGDPNFPRPENALLPEFEATGEYTLEVTTKAPLTNMFFDNLMAWTPIASPDALEDRDALVTKPVGTGPYTIDEIVPDVSMSFERNPDYWNPDAFDFDTVTFLKFADGVAAINALKSGQIDVTTIVPANAADAEASGLRISSAAAGYVGVWMTDVSGSIVPALGDVRVRQAIAMSLDQASIIEAVDQGWGETGSQVFTKGQPEYVDGGDDRYTYDVDAAKALMAEAGYADGFEVTMPRVPGFVPEEYIPVVEQSLGELGITIAWDDMDIGQLIAAWADKTVPMFILTANYNLLSREGLAGAQAYFPQLVDDPGFAALKHTEDVGSLDESLAASDAIGEYILDQAWIAPITQKVNMWASIPTVSYTPNNLDGRQQLRNFTLVEE
jgi:peptide/nickel transport system substrate-binding protein